MPSDSSPWSHVVTWQSVRSGDIPLILIGDAAVRARVAQFLALESVELLRADLTMCAWMDGMALRGRLEGRVTRLCGITLEPFEELIDTPLTFRVVPQSSPHAIKQEGGEVMIDLEADDPPDTVEGDVVDIGGYVVEALALALDPFPRKAGAVFEAPVESPPLSPFAALRNLPSV